jgi:hypothetical protein
MRPTILLLLVAGAACAPEQVGVQNQATFAPGTPWPGGVVYYSVEDSFNNNPDTMKALHDGLLEYKTLTSLTFTRLYNPPASTNMIVYRWENVGCDGNSTVPRTNGPGWLITIHCANRTSIIHETGHAIGLQHEQERPDSRKNVTCHGSCIDTTAECTGSTDPKCVTDPCNHGGDFAAQAGPQRVWGPYDLDSMMQYRSGDVENAPSCWTITDKNGGTIFHLNDLSIGDINTLRQVYQQALGTEANGDQFGQQMAAGDFDGDGYVDLAIGAPAKNSVFLFKGTYGPALADANGMSRDYAPRFSALVPWKVVTPSDFGVTAQSGEQFGSVLLAAEIDGDRRAKELLIGAPGRNNGAGAAYLMIGHVYVWPSSGDPPLPPLHDGLEPDPNTGIITQANIGAGAGSPGDAFGFAFAVGDFDNDGFNDVAIGAPNANGVGNVILLTHQPTTGVLQFWKRLAPSDLGYGFGAALVSADWDNDNYADLAVGAPDSNGSGRVYMFLSTAGLTQTQNIAMGTHADGDQFGTALAAGSFYGTGQQLAVGAPGWGGSGRIVVYEWDAVNARMGSPQRLDQSVVNLTNDAGDRFGAHLTPGYLHGTQYTDLLVGMPYKTDAGVSQAGVMVVLRGSSSLLDGSVHHQDWGPVANGWFGKSVVTGDFDNDGNEEAAIGASGLAMVGPTAGMALVLRGSSVGISDGQGEYLWQGKNQ